MASIVPNVCRLTSKTILATKHSAVKKARGKKKTNKIYLGWILCFAGCLVPPLDRLEKKTLGDLDWTWAEQLAKHRFQLNGKISANQFWSSAARIGLQQGGILILTVCSLAHVDSWPSTCKSGSQALPKTSGTPSWMACGGQTAVMAYFCGLYLRIWLCHYWIVVVVFHFDSGRVKAGKGPSATLHHANECLVVRYLRHSWAYNAVRGILTPSPQSGTGTTPTSTEGFFNQRQVAGGQKFVSNNISNALLGHKRCRQMKNCEQFSSRGFEMTRGFEMNLEAVAPNKVFDARIS